MSSQSLPVSFLMLKVLFFEKVCALNLLLRYFFPEQRFATLSEYIEAGLAKVYFDGEPDIPADAVDIDVRSSYRKTAYKSAFSRVANERKMMGIAAVRHLAGLLDSNNTSGCLRKPEATSLVRLCRECLDEKVKNGTVTRADRVAVIDAMFAAIDAYFTAWQDADMALTVVGMENPFTLESFRLLDKSNIAAADRFAEMLGLEEELQAKAKAEAQELQARTFEVKLAAGGVGTLPARLIVTDNTRVPKAYLELHSNVVFLVAVNAARDCTMMWRGEQDVESLLHHLNGREPGRWNLKTVGKHQFLFGRNRAGDNFLTGDGLVDAVERHYAHVSRKQREAATTK